jgi:uncharacterized protein YecE (DUF72 family)
VGTGGWTFAPWRGTFYPADLPLKGELEFAARALTSIEINGTFYSSFTPETWRKWRDATPAGFVFAVKAARYCTQQRSLANAGRAVEVFLKQGLAELGAKLGPINWQLPATKVFDAKEIAAFLELLPERSNGVTWRHALEVRHPSFAAPAFYKLARKRGIAIVCARSPDYPQIDERTADFSYARFMTTQPRLRQGMSAAQLQKLAAQCRKWAKSGDVFAYFIAAAKVRNPAAAQALGKLTSA